MLIFMKVHPSNCTLYTSTYGALYRISYGAETVVIVRAYAYDRMRVELVS